MTNEEKPPHANLVGRVACKCCGYITMDPAEYDDQCAVCDWTQDDIQEREPYEVHCPNGVTLREAQQNFLRCGSYVPYYVSVRRPLAERVAQYARDPDWKPLPPLDSMSP
ncbi:MAG: hypothetical protein DWQ37_09425 [Planctomycetota bacterium]|nr:MAG: hypothetical protein DWQ37_09425 [Planctomycetota bacterium]